MLRGRDMASLPQGHGRQALAARGSRVRATTRLYQLIRQQKPIVDRTFVIEFLDPGVEAFAFTFG